MAGVDRQTLVELIEAEKAKLSPEARDAWDDFDISMYTTPEVPILMPHQRDMVKDWAYLPAADQHLLYVLLALRDGLHRSDSAESQGSSGQEIREWYVKRAADQKDKWAGRQIDPDLTLQQALARLKEDQPSFPNWGTAHREAIHRTGTNFA